MKFELNLKFNLDFTVGADGFVVLLRRGTQTSAKLGVKEGKLFQVSKLIFPLGLKFACVIFKNLQVTSEGARGRPRRRNGRNRPASAACLFSSRPVREKKRGLKKGRREVRSKDLIDALVLLALSHHHLVLLGIDFPRACNH